MASTRSGNDRRSELAKSARCKLFSGSGFPTHVTGDNTIKLCFVALDFQP